MRKKVPADTLNFCMILQVSAHFGNLLCSQGKLMIHIIFQPTSHPQVCKTVSITETVFIECNHKQTPPQNNNLTIDVVKKEKMIEPCDAVNGGFTDFNDTTKLIETSTPC